MYNFSDQRFSLKPNYHFQLIYNKKLVISLHWTVTRHDDPRYCFIFNIFSIKSSRRQYSFDFNTKINNKKWLTIDNGINKNINLIILSDPELLSVQQLTKSIELFPPAAIPTPPQKLDVVPQETQNGKLWNYHSNVPYFNQIGNKRYLYLLFFSYLR